MVSTLGLRLVLALCILGTTVLTAANDVLVQYEHHTSTESYEPFRHGELNQRTGGALAAREAWKPEKRQLFIGVGVFNMFNVGTEANPNRGDKEGFLRDHIRKALDNLCGTRRGFNACDTSRGYRIENVYIKTSEGVLAAHGWVEIKVGASYFPEGRDDLREAIVDTMAWTYHIVAGNNPYKPGFKGDRWKDGILYNAPDKVIVRVDYIGFLVLLLSGSHDNTKDGPLKLCPMEGFNTDETYRKLAEHVDGHFKDKMAKSLGLASNNLDRRIDCYWGTNVFEQPGTGDGWCRDEWGGYKNHCP